MERQNNMFGRVNTSQSPPNKTTNIVGGGKRNLVDGRHALLRPLRLTLLALLLMCGLSVGWGWLPKGVYAVTIEVEGNRTLVGKLVLTQE